MLRDWRSTTTMTQMVIRHRAAESGKQVGLFETPVPLVMYILGKTSDIVFTLDLVLTFNLAFIPTADSHNRGAGEVYERRPAIIAAHYMAMPFSENMTAGWFWPDLLTIIPWDAFSIREDLNSVRLVRILRLVRMLRLVRVLKLFKRWQTRTGASYSLIKIGSCLCSTLMIVHWLACIWAHLGRHPLIDTNKTWLINHLTEDQDISVMSMSMVYNTALYFCTVVLTGVGFGDIVPSNDVEVATLIVTNLLTGITWAWVVANVVNFITNMDVYGTHFNQIMDDVNSLMNTSAISPHLKFRIRRHIHESYNIQRRRHHQEAIKWLSAGLQGELAIESGVARICFHIWYFRDARSSVLIELADEFHGNIFSPNEIIMNRNSASVITRGSCIKRGKMFSRDAVLGADMILATESLRDTACPRTITYMEVMEIHRDSLKEAATKFPEFDQRLRRAQIKLGFWRAFVRTAEQIKIRREQANKGRKKSGTMWDKQFFSGNGDAPVVTAQEVVKAEPKRVGWVESMDRTNNGFAHVHIAQQLTRAPTVQIAESNSEVLDQLDRLTGGMGELEKREQLRQRAVEERFDKIEERVDKMDGILKLFNDQINVLSSQIGPK